LVWIITKVLEVQHIIPESFPILFGLMGSVLGCVIGNMFGIQKK
jgi:hypothetical protein